jgi:hypothetical protein
MEIGNGDGVFVGLSGSRGVDMRILGCFWGLDWKFIFRGGGIGDLWGDLGEKGGGKSGR